MGEAMDHSTEPLLDRDILNENTMGSVPLQEELFALFFEQGDLYIAQLEEALRDGDADAWRMTAHGVKGASRSLGLIRLASMALEAEQSDPAGDLVALLREAMAQTREIAWPQEDAA